MGSRYTPEAPRSRQRHRTEIPDMAPVAAEGGAEARHFLDDPMKARLRETGWACLDTEAGPPYPLPATIQNQEVHVMTYSSDRQKPLQVDGPVRLALRKISGFFRPPTTKFPDPRLPLDLEPVVVPIEHELARIEAGAMLLNDIQTCPDCCGTTEVLALTEAGFPRALGEVQHQATCPLLRD